LRTEESTLIRRIAGDTPAGQMMRRYWFPALLAEEVAEPDCDPVRVRILGENLVAFRDSRGRLGIVTEACPHRLTSLALGRNEEGGLRCIYHGWKFDVGGRCLDMPTEPADYGYRDRVRIAAYPVREAGGLVWTYLGPPEREPAFPAFPWTALPRTHVAVLKFLEHVNYLQAAEGAIDSAHTRFLHRGSVGEGEEAKRNAISLDLAPRLEVADTTYGFRYAALRRPLRDPDRFTYAKVTRFVFPTTAVTASSFDPARPDLSQIFVPVDDEWTMHYTILHSLDGKPLDERAIRRQQRLEPGVDLDRWFRPHATAENWWNQDRAAMRGASWTGMVGVMNQDTACQESMGPLVDHRREHLGTSDVAIIRMRRRMLENVRRFMAGQPPIGLDAAIPYDRLGNVPQRVIPIDEPWQLIDTYPGEYVEREGVGAR
jgi:phthalate 4,5-dioxygenase oxygenase subunit